MGKVIFSLCPHLGGGQVQPRRGRSGQSANRGGVRSSWGGGSGPAGQGGSGPAGGGGGGSGPVSGGRSASCALLRAVCFLRSRRRTFLFDKVLANFLRYPIAMWVVAVGMNLKCPFTIPNNSSYNIDHLSWFRCTRTAICNNLAKSFSK